MASPNASHSAARLEPPRTSVDDPGAHELGEEVIHMSKMRGRIFFDHSNDLAVS